MKRFLSNKAKTLKFESLENRELLSVNPLEASSGLILQSCISQEQTEYAVSAPEEAIGLNLDETMNEMLISQGQNPQNLSENFVFSLNSKPGSNHTIYLDFTGHTTTKTLWNSSRNKETIITPAYDVDGVATRFSNQELRNIYEIWLRVSEDYLPFDVNVTTAEPSADMLMKSASGDETYGVRVCIGGHASDWYTTDGSATGVSYKDVFDYSNDLPAFVFSEDCSTNQHVADSASHETGHALSLSHDGNGSQEYYFGASGWGPIMGGAGYQELVQWSKGEYSGATNHEDDLAKISSRIGYRADDHGDNLASATRLSITRGEIGRGIIERNTDVDFFSFSLTGEDVALKVGGIKNVTNLDVKATIYNGSGTVVGEYNPTDTLYATIDVSNFSPGLYYMKVEGTGKTVGGTSFYTNYGSLGAYTIETTTSTAQTVWTVNTTDDSATSGAMSLRKAIQSAGEGDVIEFSPSLDGAKISVGSTLSIGKSLTIDASALSHGVTLDGGGKNRILSAYSSGKSLTIVGIEFANGYVQGDGAAITFYGETLRLQDCTFTKNHSQTPGSWTIRGGAIHMRSGTLLAESCAFRSNKLLNESCPFSGGGALGGEPNTLINVFDCTFEDNTTNKSGGAIRTYGDINIDRSSFTGNESEDSGGAVASYWANLTVKNSVFVENASDYSGGAIYCNSTVSAFIESTLIARNSAAYGGGAYLYESGGVLINLTLADNVAAYYGGGLYINSATSLYNNIFYNNISNYWNGVSDLYGGTGFSVTGSYNLTTGGSREITISGSNNVLYNSTKPLFVGAIGGAGGEYSYKLAEGSQAIDRGDNTSVNCTVDVDGVTRIINGIVDFGAYEFDNVTPTVSVLSYDPATRQASLKWREIDSATSYTVKLSKDGGTTWTSYKTGLSDTTTQVNGLYTGKSYVFRVYGVSSSGATLADYAERTFTPFSISSSAKRFMVCYPVSVTTTAAESASYSVKWYSVTGNGEVEIKSARNQLSYAPNDRTYNIKVVVTGLGESEGCYSSLTFTKPSQCKTVTVSSYDPSTRKATLDWTEIPGASSYTVKLSKDDGETWVNYKTGLKTTTVETNGLYAGKSYRFRIFGLDSAGSVIATSYAERTFVPVALSSSSETYTVGTKINVTRTAAADASTYTRWYFVTEEGDVEITSARSKLSYTPTSSDYDIKVVVTGTGVSSGSVASLVFTNAAVVTVTSYDPTTRQATLEWDKIPGASTYKLQLSKNGGETWTNYKTGLTAPSTTVNGLYAGKTYEFRVYGVSSSGATVEGVAERSFAPISLTSAGDTYSVGTAIKVTSAGASSASSTLQWFYVKENGDVEITSARNKLTFTPTTANYSIKVVSTGTGASAGCVTTLVFSTASAITVTNYDSASRQAKLEWDAVSDASTYRLQISKNGGETWTNYKTGLTSTSATVNGIYAGKSYRFRVYGVSSSGATLADVSERTFAPIALNASEKTYNVGSPITATLLGESNASSTIRWYNVTPNGDVEITFARDKLTYVPSDSTYPVKVVATGVADSAGCSSTLIFTARSTVSIASYDSTTRQAPLKWDAISGATTYRLQLSKDGGVTWSNYKTGLTTPSVVVNGLYAGRSYDFRVYGVSSSGATLDDVPERTFAPIAATSSDVTYRKGAPITVTQTAASNASSTIRWYNVTPNGEVEITSARGKLTYTPTSTDYDIKVVATGEGNSEGSSSTLVFTSYSSIRVTSYDATTRQATLEWGAISGASTYKLQISKNDGATWSNYKTGLTTTSATVNGLYVGKSYGFRVYGVSSSGATLPNYHEKTFSPSNGSNSIIDEAFADFFEKEFFEA